MMLLKRRAIFTFIIGLSLLGGQLSSLAQNTKYSKTYNTPTRLVLNGVGEPPKSDENGYISMLTESFYPIGFSKDGKFAYYVEPADEACGCYIAKLVIQDLRTDKILWEHSYMSDEPGAPADQTVKTYWKKKRGGFSRKLAQYGIKAKKSFTLKYPTINYKSDLFTPKLDLKIKTDVYSVDGTVSLSMFSKQKGTKTIYNKRYDPKKVNSIRSAEISGVLLSPFESRVAVVVIETHRGWEGLPNITRIKIVGSDLKTRFR